MKVEYSKSFIKEVSKLSENIKQEIACIIKTIKDVRDIKDIPNNKKLKGYKDVYRIRISSYRIIYLKQTNDGIFMIYIAPRSKAYNKEFQSKIKGL